MEENKKGIVDLILSMENEKNKNDFWEAFNSSSKPEELHAKIQALGFTDVTLDECEQIYANKNKIEEHHTVDSAFY